MVNASALSLFSAVMMKTKKTRSTTAAIVGSSKYRTLGTLISGGYLQYCKVHRLHKLILVLTTPRPVRTNLTNTFCTLFNPQSLFCCRGRVLKGFCRMLSGNGPPSTRRHRMPHIGHRPDIAEKSSAAAGGGGMLTLRKG